MTYGLRIYDASGEIVSDPAAVNPRLHGCSFTLIAGHDDGNEPDPPGVSFGKRFKTIPGMENDGTWAVISESSEVMVESIASGGFYYFWVPATYVPDRTAFLILRLGGN